MSEESPDNPNGEEVDGAEERPEIEGEMVALSDEYDDGEGTLDTLEKEEVED